MKLQSTMFELLSGRVLSCILGRKPYRCVWLTGGGSSGCSTCVGIFKTLLNRLCRLAYCILCVCVCACACACARARACACVCVCVCVLIGWPKSSKALQFVRSVCGSVDDLTFTATFYRH